MKPFAAAIFSLTTLSLTLTGNASQAENAVSDGDFAVTAPAETSRTDDSLRLMAQEVAQDDAAATNGPVYREMIYGDPAAPIHQHVAPRYIEKSPAEIGVPNMVTSVLASYRGYDTLGETTVIFTAGLGLLLLIGQSLRFRDKGENP